MTINSLPNGKTLDQSKFKDIADDKIYVTQKLSFAKGWVENIVGNGENAGHQHFLRFQVFLKGFFSRVIKSRDYVVKG